MGNVIYIYSFSLTFIPGLSLAFITGNRDLIRALSYLVSVRLMASDWMTQKLLGMYLDDGIYYTSLLKFRDVYRTNRDLVCQKLDELAPLGVSYTKPRGGVYVWCRLPDGVDSKQFIRRAYNMGVTLIPGHVFYPCKNGGRDHIRILRAAGAGHGRIAQSAGRRAGGMTGTRNGKSTDTSQAPFESVYFTA